jgi:phage portal protein BeeE
MGIRSTLIKALGGTEKKSAISVYDQMRSAVSVHMRTLADTAPAKAIDRVQLVQNNPIAFACCRRLAMATASVKWLVDGKDSGDIAEIMNTPYFGSQQDQFGL